MGLQQYQWRVKPNRLYSVRKLNSLLSNQQLEPNIMVNGKVNIYGLNSEVRPNLLNEMFLPPVNRNVSGFAAFEIIPCYLYCQGQAEDIILSGIEVLADLGELEG